LTALIVLAQSATLAQQPILEVLVEAVDARHPTLASDVYDRILVGYEKTPPQPPHPLQNDVWIRRFDFDGAPLGLPHRLTTPGDRHFHISAAINREDSPTVYMAWIGTIEPFGEIDKIEKIQVALFEFPVNIAPLPAITEDPRWGDDLCSAGVGQEEQTGYVHRSVSWTSEGRYVENPPRGLLYAINSEVDAPEQIRGCEDPICFVRSTQWQPCLFQRTSPDSYFLVLWSEAEHPEESGTPYDIVMQLYDEFGIPVGAELAVNSDVSQLETTETSPAVAFDSAGHIVAVWEGRNPDDCYFPVSPADRRIYARRFFWDGDPAHAIIADGPQFIVDSAQDWVLPSLPAFLVNGNPTVALKNDDSGAFVIAWTAVRVPSNPRMDVRAVYFNADGTPRGREFSVTQLLDPNFPELDYYDRFLSESAQHVCSYWADDSFAIAWTATHSVDQNDSVYMTILPPDYADTTCPQVSCLKGDCNNDTFVNGLDIQPFVHALIDGVPDPNLCEFAIFVNPELLCPYDCNCDCRLTYDDVPRFVTNLLGVTSGCPGGGPPAPIADCNGNGIDDVSDIFLGTSQDCNRNYIPDECDVDETDPDANGLVSDDDNANSVPDECEPDCNRNGIPDDKDIADSTSLDINANNVPDECDPDCDADGEPDDFEIANGAPDCNLNGIPDGCEQDCNQNGVPDDCDIDPTDPDGDEWVSPDCNGNNWPDECDIAAGPFWGSADTNDNGVPDECEESFMGGAGQAPGAPSMGGPGGGEGGGGEPMTPEQLEAAWEEFFEWYSEQTWGPASPYTGAEQYQRFVDKLAVLGLPFPLFP